MTKPQKNAVRIDQLIKELASLQSQIDAISFCNIAVGTYSGDDTDNREITGMGFDPKIVWIVDSSGGNHYHNFTHEDFTAWVSSPIDAGQATATNLLRIITDGFEVNNNDGSDRFNNLGNTYYYVCLG